MMYVFLKAFDNTEETFMIIESPKWLVTSSVGRVSVDISVVNCLTKSYDILLLSFDIKKEHRVLLSFAKITLLQTN